MSGLKELNEYRHFMKPAELDKAINMLRGIVAGIKSSGEVNDLEVSELINWCSLHENLRDRHPFTELLPKIDAAWKMGRLARKNRKTFFGSVTTSLERATTSISSRPECSFFTG